MPIFDSNQLKQLAVIFTYVIVLSVMRHAEPACAAWPEKIDEHYQERGVNGAFQNVSKNIKRCRIMCISEVAWHYNGDA